MAVNDNALIEVVEYLTFANKDKDNENIPNDQIEFLIDAVSTFIAADTERTLVPITTINEIVFGTGTDTYWSKQMRFASFTSVSEWQSTQFVELLVGTYPYTTENDLGKFYFTQGRTLSPSIRYKFIFTTGWKRSNVPDPIKYVACVMVQRLIKAAEAREGVTSESYGDSTTSFDLDKAYTDKLAAMISPYKRIL